MDQEFDSAVICPNGHVLTQARIASPSHDNFCVLCGEKPLPFCPHCKRGIKGARIEKIHARLNTRIATGIDSGHLGWNVAEPMVFPSYCHECGKPYPWTVRLLDAVRQAVELAPELDAQEKRELPDLIEQGVIRSGPGAPAAVEKAKPILKKLSQEARKSISNAVEILFKAALSEGGRQLFIEFMKKLS